MYVRPVTEVVDDIAALADIPAGPRLAAALARIDATRVPNNDLLALLAAEARQAAHEAARLLGVIAEIGRATPTFDDGAVDRLDRPVPHAADEVRAALAWSRRAADRECDLAEQLVHDLPQVYAAFLAGDIDRSKVRVFADHLAGLTQAQIATVCEVLLPVAGRVTPGQLVVRLRRLVAAIDPRHYERRYRKALRDRTVCAWLDENGTAVLCARGLSPAQAQSAIERIDLLAHAARRAGHPSTLDQIRVDILAGLLDGTLHHLDRDQIIARLLTHRSGNDDPLAAGRDTKGDEAAAGPAEDGSTLTLSDDQRVGVEVRVALSSLLGHDDHPGEIAGLGPIPATHARAVVADQRRAEWRWAITDASGGSCSTASPADAPPGSLPPGRAAGSSSYIYPRRFSPSSPRRPGRRAGGGAVGRGAGRHRPPVRRTRPARPRRPPRRPVAPRRAAPPHPDSRSLLRRHRMPQAPHPLRPGPHRRLPGRWRDRRGRPGTPLPSRPHPQRPGRLDPAAAQPREPSCGSARSAAGTRFESEPVLPPPPDACPGPDDPWHDEAAPPGPDTLIMYGPDPPPSPPAGEPEPVDLDTPPPF